MSGAMSVAIDEGQIPLGSLTLTQVKTATENQNEVAT